MKHPALKMFIVSVCFLPFATLAGGLPEPPTVVEVTSILYNKHDTIKMLATILGIPITIGVILEGIRRWKKRH